MDVDWHRLDEEILLRDKTVCLVVFKEVEGVDLLIGLGICWKIIPKGGRLCLHNVEVCAVLCKGIRTAVYVILTKKEGFVKADRRNGIVRHSLSYTVLIVEI